MDQPNVDPGDDVMFTVMALGSDLTYQWQRDGSDITDNSKYSGTTSSLLTVMDVVEGDEGGYRCLVRNAVNVGGLPSREAQLTVRKFFLSVRCCYQCSPMYCAMIYQCCCRAAWWHVHVLVHMSTAQLHAVRASHSLRTSPSIECPSFEVLSNAFVLHVPPKRVPILSS